MVIFLFSSVLWALSAGDLVENVATATYTVHGVDKEINSNTVSNTVEQSDAEISFLYATPTATQSVVLGTSAYRDENGVLHTGKEEILVDGTVLGGDSTVRLDDTGFYGLHDTAIVKVTDFDQNVDRNVRDHLEVTITVDNGDIEQLRLLETGSNTGVFVGYIALSTTTKKLYDNRLFVQAGETIVAKYDNQATDSKTDSAKIVLKKEFKVWIEKEVNKAEASVGELLKYTITVHNDESFEVKDMRIDDALPLGLKFQKGTARLNGHKVTLSHSKDGRHLFLGLPPIPANSTVELTFLGAITAGVQHSEVRNEAWVQQKDVFTSNIAFATTHIKEELMRSEGIIVGQVYDEAFDNNKTAHGVAGVHLYLESGVYVVTDKAGKYHFEGVKAGRHVVQVDKALLPQGYLVGSCSQNARFAGNNFSQFVNVGRGALKRVDFCLKRNRDKLEKRDKSYMPPTKVAKMPNYRVSELKRGKSRAILWPPEGYVPSIPSTKIAIKHPKSERIDLWLNGYRVSRINYDGAVTSKSSSNVIDLYRGVDLLERGNTIKVEYFNRDNKLIETLERKVHVSSAPVQALYVKENSKPIADGKHSPVIAVKFLDESALPLRSGITGTYSVEAPYASQDVLDQMKNNPLANRSTQSKYVVDSDGIAYIKLQPTTESGEVILHFNLQGRDEVVRAWLKPALREWIMVGFAEGTVGYNRLKGHKESLSEIGAKDRVIKEGRVSFFAKGKVKGDWLLSLAYDTGKDTKESKLFDEIDPNRYYTLYGDNTQQYQEASSRKKLYVKVEKEQFNLLLGDFNTDLSYTELSSYSRSFTGVKSEYHGENLKAKLFASHTEQLFVKDEIRGDGTSGYYYLKSKNIVNFSEKITIEVRNRYRNEEIISTTSLQRFKDYEIDYALGRIYFKEPIYSRDENFNPRYIVVDYEIRGEGGKHYTYGGRTAIKSKDDKMELGGTYISEDSGKKQINLMGSDVRLQVGVGTEIRAEYAKTKTTQEAKTTTGTAKLVEVEHLGGGLHTRAYYREQDASFGLGQLSSTLGATRKIGLDLSQQFENRQTHQLSLYRESNLLNNTNSDVLEFRTQIDKQTWGAFAGYRYAKRTFDEMAQQILLGASKSFFDQRLKLSATHEQTLSESESKLFPTKTGLGLSYALSSTTDVFTNYEWAGENELGRVGVRFRPWSGVSIENTTLSEISNDSQNIYNTLGVLQSFQLTDKVGVNVGYEEGRSIDGNNSLVENLFHAYRLGFNYNDKLYSTTLSGEFRDGSDMKRVNITGGVYSQVNSDLAIAFGGNYNTSDGTNRRTGEKHKSSDVNLRFSLAYRPEETTTILLDKLDYLSATLDDGTQSLNGAKLINNMNLNLTPTKKSEIALQHGIKYVKERIEKFEYKGLTQLFGVDAHYDLTKNWEVGVQGSWLYAQSANNSDYGLGIYSGHNLFDNMLLTLGYNFKGFDDQDFSLQTYRVEGVYFRFNIKFDQDSLKDVVKGMSW